MIYDPTLVGAHHPIGLMRSLFFVKMRFRNGITTGTGGPLCKYLASFSSSEKTTDFIYVNYTEISESYKIIFP